MHRVAAGHRIVGQAEDGQHELGQVGWQQRLVGGAVDGHGGPAGLAQVGRDRGDAEVVLLDGEGLVELAGRAVRGDIQPVAVGLGADPELGEVLLKRVNVRRGLPKAAGELAHGQRAERHAVRHVGLQQAGIAGGQDEGHDLRGPRGSLAEYGVTSERRGDDPLRDRDFAARPGMRGGTRGTGRHHQQHQAGGSPGGEHCARPARSCPLEDLQCGGPPRCLYSETAPGERK